MSSSSIERRGAGSNLKLAFLAAVAILVLAAIVALRRILTPVAVALAIAYIADPLLNWLERHQVRRWLATVVLYAGCLALLSLAAATLGPKIGNQAQRLYQYVSGLARDYGATVLRSDAVQSGPEARKAAGAAPAGGAEEDTGKSRPFRQDLGGRGEQEAAAGTESGDSIQSRESGVSASGLPGAISERLPEWAARVRDYLHGHADEIASHVAGWAVTAVQNAVKGLSNAASFVLGLVLVLVFTFFFMLHFRRMVRAVGRYVPAAQRERTLRIVGRIDSAVSDFFRGRLLVCLIAGVVYVVGLRLCAIDFWHLIGVAGGVLSFIPILGVILPLIPACAFALLTAHPWASLLGVIVTFSAVQWVVEPVAGTLILSRQVRMHPVTVILSLLIGGYLFGVFGVILSVPVAAVARILGEEFVLPPLRQMAER